MQYEIDALVVVDADSEDEAFEKAQELADTVEKFTMGTIAVLEGIDPSAPVFGEVEVKPFRPNPDTGEHAEGIVRLDRLADGAPFEDAEGRVFSVVSQGPAQGSTEIVDRGTHAYYDSGTRVRRAEARLSAEQKEDLAGRLEQAGWPAAAEDVRDGHSPETVLSQLNRIGMEGESVESATELVAAFVR